LSYVGAKPVYVDIDPVTYNINPANIEQAITPKTKAILPVHLYGQACDMESLTAIAKKHNLTLLEDAAQAHGVRFGGKRIGSFGRAGCFSFYPGKNLGAFGEGGAVVTDDDALAARVKRLRDHAQDGRHNHVEIGYNTRMEGLQGAVLDVKLKQLDAWNAARDRHARRYHELLSDVRGIQLPALPEPGSHVWHLFVIVVRDKDRNAVQKELAERGVATGVHYPTPVPLQPVYKGLGHKPGDFPVAENVMRRCLSLPMFAELTEAQIAHVAKSVRECV
jgi:dTDP-4-amino-4,6-dideoxygalactose transaminase